MANKENSARGRENSKCKSPKLGTCPACFRNSEVCDVAGMDG